MSEQTPSRTGNLPMKIGGTVLVVIIFLAVVIYSRSNADKTEVANTNETVPAVNTTTNNTNTEKPIATSGYRNGTYTASGSYTTPGGREDVAVTLTLADGKVTTSSVAIEAKAPTSAQFQKEFSDNYKQFVTGKSIDSLKLSKVSGSSLTSGGFNAAIEKIKADAKI